MAEGWLCSLFTSALCWGGWSTPRPSRFTPGKETVVDSSWNVMAHGDAREGKWRGNWRMEWVASTLHTTSEYGVSSITTADAHTSAASSRLNWRPRRFNWTRPFRRKTKSGFCACAITFQLACTHCTGGWVCLRTSMNGRGKLIFTGTETRDCSVGSRSLYRLLFSDHHGYYASDGTNFFVSLNAQSQ